MRSLWKGSISFGLINIPISLYSATQRDELHFRLLRASDLSPVNYKRVAEADGKEVPWDEIVKGFEHQKGEFVVLTEEDFKQVDVKSTQTVEILDFVALAEIDPMFFQKPFYMEPAKNGMKAYALLRDALRSTGKVGIAKVVIKTRQHLAAVKPNEQGLILELMHFADELVDAKSLQLPAKTEFSKGEMEMAKTLIEQMTEDWQPEKYTDEYKAALLELIEKKVASGGRTPSVTKPKLKTEANVIDLVEVLQQSLNDARQQGRHKKKSAPSAKTKPKKAV
jgi:DNA end-binding protein Ku